MNYKIIFILFLAQIVHGQIPYFNIQFNYENRWETSGFSTLETDSCILVPSFAGAASTLVWDTAFVLKINKFDATLQYKKIGFFEGQSAVNIVKTSKKNNYIN